MLIVFSSVFLDQFFPNETNGRSDAEVLVMGNIMQRFSKNKAAQVMMIG